MGRPDFNLLVTLDALLAEGSVAKAGRRLGLSPSAMSRALARLRAATGDPLLVRAGRGLVPTPRAEALRVEVRHLVDRVETTLRPTEQLQLGALERTFTLRTSEGFVENFGPALIARVASEAPRVRLHFVPKPDKDSAPLRQGAVDLETGVVESDTAPELRVQALFRDRWVGVVAKRHPLAKPKVTPARYAGGRHILVTRPGMAESPIDEALKRLGLSRPVIAVVAGFAVAIRLAAQTDLVATVPEKHSGNLTADLHTFPLPFPTPSFTVSMLWHPRQDADPAHQWLRGCVKACCFAKD